MNFHKNMVHFFPHGSLQYSSYKYDINQWLAANTTPVAITKDFSRPQASAKLGMKKKTWDHG